jgi:hypothetical protein
MRRFAKVVLVIGMAGAVSLATFAVPAKVRVSYPGSMDCQQGCEFVAAGWPFPYVVDHPGISPVGSVSLSGALLGEDIVRPGAAVATFVFWLVVVSAATALFNRMLRNGQK